MFFYARIFGKISRIKRSWWSKIVLLFLKRLTPKHVFDQIYIMTSVVSILQVIRDAAQRVYSFSNDQAG